MGPTIFFTSCFCTEKSPLSLPDTDDGPQSNPKSVTELGSQCPTRQEGQGRKILGFIPVTPGLTNR